MFIYRLLFVSMLFCSLSYAGKDYTLVSNDALASQHAWDHIGTSYALNMVMYGVFHKGFGFPRVQSVIFAGVTTFIFSTVYSLSGNSTPECVKRDMAPNLVGIGLSAGTVFAFEF